MVKETFNSNRTLIAFAIVILASIVVAITLKNTIKYNEIRTLFSIFGNGNLGGSKPYTMSTFNNPCTTNTINLNCPVYTNSTQVKSMELNSLLDNLCTKYYVLNGKCKKKHYIQSIINDNLRQECQPMIDIVTRKMNINNAGMKFIFNYLKNLIIFINEKGSKHYIMDTFFQIDGISGYSYPMEVRLLIDCVVISPKTELSILNMEIEEKENLEEMNFLPSYNADKDENILKNYPTPMDVIVTGLETTKLPSESSNMKKSVHFNCVKIFNNDIILNAMCIYDTDRQLIVEGITDNVLDYTKYTGCSTPYIEPSRIRNKWPHLNFMPKKGEQGQWPCVEQDNSYWNNLGVYPPKKTNSKCPGIRASTEMMPLQPTRHPINWETPLNDGEYSWLFDRARGIPGFSSVQGYSDYQKPNTEPINRNTTLSFPAVR